MAATMVMVSTAAQASSKSQIKRGGALSVVIVNTVWPDLDPAVDPSDAADQELMSAVYGQMFENGPNHTLRPDIATGYSYSDKNLTLNVTIRHGVKFQDGESYTASAVAASMTRDLLPSNACICDGTFSDVSSITSSGKNLVHIHLKSPNSTILESFIGTAFNWTIPPLALASESEATFGQHPIGAGPFEVVSNVENSQLTVQRNPTYWDKPRPYLDSLTFTTVGTDQSAIAAVEAGSVQTMMGITTASVIASGKAAGIGYLQIPGTQNIYVEMLTYKPPFNNILAREALYYATDSKQIAETVSPNFYSLSESEATPGDQFYEKTVPGYRTYDPAKAAAIVKELGGLSFVLQSGTAGYQQLSAGALQSEWSAVGINASIQVVPTATFVADVNAGTFQAHVAYSGAYDPDLGIPGLEDEFGSTGAVSGTKDPALDGMINKSEAFLNPTNRQRSFDQIYEYIAKNAYAPIIYSPPVDVFYSKQLTGEKFYGGTANTVDFEYVSYK